MSQIYKLRDWINQDKIHWNRLSSNKNPNAIHLLEQNMDKINWRCLSGNPNAIHLLEQNRDEINWEWLSKNPNAIHLLEQNPEKIKWPWLSGNPNAIHILEKNQDKIDWRWLSENPNIFVLNYEYLKARTSIIKEELIMRYWHPSNIEKWLEMYGDDFELYI